MFRCIDEGYPIVEVLTKPFDNLLECLKVRFVINIQLQYPSSIKKRLTASTTSTPTP